MFFICKVLAFRIMDAYKLLNSLNKMIARGFDPDACLDSDPWTFFYLLLNPEVLFHFLLYENTI